MNAMKTAKATRRILGVATGAVLATLVGLWPLTTEADDSDSAMAEGYAIGHDDTRAGAIEATSKLVRDEATPSKWYMEVRFVNRNPNQDETAQFEERIERTAYQPVMARAEPMPTAVWSIKEDVALGPGKESVVRHALPRQVSAQLSNYAKREQLANAGNNDVRIPRVVTSYSTSVVGKSAPEGSSAVARGPAKRPARSVPSQLAARAPDPIEELPVALPVKPAAKQATKPMVGGSPNVAPLPKRIVVSKL